MPTLSGGKASVAVATITGSLQVLPLRCLSAAIRPHSSLLQMPCTTAPARNRSHPVIFVRHWHVLAARYIRHGSICDDQSGVFEWIVVCPHCGVGSGCLSGGVIGSTTVPEWLSICMIDRFPFGFGASIRISGLSCALPNRRNKQKSIIMIRGPWFSTSNFDTSMRLQWC